jgi:hypothetical protein
MVKAILSAGGLADDILKYAAYFEANATDPKIAKLRLVLKHSHNGHASKNELMGAWGPALLREWIKITKDITRFGLCMSEIKTFISYERKKDLVATRFGKRRH